MNHFIQLYDPYTSAHISIDKQSFVLKISSNDTAKETRLKPFHCAILYALFEKHPQPVAYEEIMRILQSNRLSCPDETRLHRKISEIRSMLSKLDSQLEAIICNNRSIGYSLPLHFKAPLTNTEDDFFTSYPILMQLIESIEQLVSTSTSMTQKCPIVQSTHGYTLDRKTAHADIEKTLNQYQKLQLQLFSELKLHHADFIWIRLEHCLAKLKTYLGLARNSEFSISKEQWIEWHEHEARQIITELLCLIKQAIKITT